MDLSTSSILPPTACLVGIDHITRPGWVRQWPFPTFEEGPPIEPRPRVDSSHSSAPTGILPHGAKIRKEDMSSSDEDDDNALANGVLEQKMKLNNRTSLPCSKTTTHPLTSDWNKAELCTADFKKHLKGIESPIDTRFIPKRVKVEFASFLEILLPQVELNESRSTIASSRASPSRPMSALSNNDRRSTTPCVSIDEISTLITVGAGSQGPTTPGTSGVLAGSSTLADVPTKHMHLSWLGKREGLSRRVHPPAVLLTLDNLSTKLLTHGPKDCLINSPRSAIVLFRNGVAINELLPSPAIVRAMEAHTAEQEAITKNLRNSARKSIAEQALHRDTVRAVGALGPLECKRELKRARLFGKILLEYHRVCDAVPFEDILSFANDYDASRPSSALRIELPPSLAPPHLVKGTRHRLLPEDVLASRFGEQFTKHTEFQSRVANIRNMQRDDKERLQRRTLQRMHSKQHQVEEACRARRALLESKREASRINDSLKADEVSHVRSKSAFHTLVKLEAAVRRTDEAGSLGRARSAMRKRYNDELVRSVQPM